MKTYTINIEQLKEDIKMYNVILEDVFINDTDIEFTLYPKDDEISPRYKCRIMDELSSKYRELDFDWFNHILRITHEDFLDLEIE